ncbi:MAG: UbiX family flavin prenyltransferase [bacterium]|nr:UbiX family flavin prenyltransferase [bacterium]
MSDQSGTKAEDRERAPLSIVLGVSGASGALYGWHLIRALALLTQGTTRLVLSPSALRVCREELAAEVETPEDYLAAALAGIAPQEREQIQQRFIIEDYRDIGAKPASGSTPSDGMAIVPCSMKSLASIAHGITGNLVERAADVCLKERRRLVVVPRETPYSRIHLQNMLALTEAGGVVLPASPGFYQRPETIDDLGRFIAGRVLGLFGIRHNLFPGWLADEQTNSQGGPA